MKNIRKVKNEIDELKKSWQGIFVSNNPFSYPFYETTEDFLIFYPTDGYHLKKNQYNAIVNTIDIIGERKFYASIIEYQGDCFNHDDHWICEFPIYDEYLKIPLILENTLCSENSTWGIIISHEDHAILGGSTFFIDHVRASYKREDKDLALLKLEWKDNENKIWLDKLLERKSCR